MTFAPAAPHVAVCALLAAAAFLLLREGHRDRTRPGHGRTDATSALHSKTETPSKETR